MSVEWGLQERYAAAYPHLAPFEQNSGPFFDDRLEAFQALHRRRLGMSHRRRDSPAVGERARRRVRA